MKDVNGVDLKNGMYVWWKRNNEKKFTHEHSGIVVNDELDLENGTIEIRVIQTTSVNCEADLVIGKFGDNLKKMTDGEAILALFGR